MPYGRQPTISAMFQPCGDQVKHASRSNQNWFPYLIILRALEFKFVLMYNLNYQVVLAASWTELILGLTKIGFAMSRGNWQFFILAILQTWTKVSLVIFILMIDLYLIMFG